MKEGRPCQPIPASASGLYKKRTVEEDGKRIDEAFDKIFYRAHANQVGGRKWGAGAGVQQVPGALVPQRGQTGVSETPERHHFGHAKIVAKAESREFVSSARRRAGAWVEEVR